MNTVHPEFEGGVIRYVACRFQMVWVTVVFLLVTQSSDAALMNLIKRGDLIQDTVSDRYWLDLSKTTNHSYDEMLIEFDCTPRCKSGPFAGFTWASTDDVFGLFSDAGIGLSDLIPIIDQDPLNAPHVDVWRFIDLIGATDVVCGPICWSPGMSTALDQLPFSMFVAVGISNELSLDPDKPEGSVRVLGMSWDTICNTWAQVQLDSCAVSNVLRGENFEKVGVWLFAPVSEPPTTVLMYGLIALIIFLKKDRTAGRLVERGKRAVPLATEG